MKVSREQAAENRARILEAAGRLFRERGFEGVSVAEVMQAAGLTHGGFYGHFKSKDDLIAKTLADLTSRREGGDRDLAAYAHAYLAPEHWKDVAGGCPVAALGVDTGRATPEAKAAMTVSLRRQIEALSRMAPGETAEAQRASAIAAWSAMVGAVVLARMSDDPALSEEVVAATRAVIEGGERG
ncbi:MAG: TetR family transcriptional regulator [Caulobacteraceae bacterium]|nr:TetR family transcriptional regulator [Caulobacteraceae bacterium]